MVTALFISSCEEDNDAVIDTSISAPVMLDPYISSDSVFTTSSDPVINFNTSVSVNINNGSSIKSVTCTIKDPDRNVIGQYNLLDNGVSPDSTAGDGIYSANVNITGINCLLVGTYGLEYVAENNSGLFSNLLTDDIKVINSANVPPFIVSTNLPDSVIRPLPGDSTLLTISVNVNDPDGLCDIKDVTFVTVRPNGVTFPPIPMFENGNGQFVFANYVGYSTDPTSYGYFKYTFTARDRSNLQSAPVTDSIKFVSPF
ncbi:MAG: hypothetical protein KBF96_00195 [Ignavibacteria bacterium]|jgi:hypothetical protein|nr:hypothetical protein [Ignavibacteria bacterium]